jgi:hypothetical protein
VDQQKLDGAVCAAITLCGTGEDRFVRLLEYMEYLKSDEHWCDAELAELHDCVKQFLIEPERPS